MVASRERGPPYSSPWQPKSLRSSTRRCVDAAAPDERRAPQPGDLLGLVVGVPLSAVFLWLAVRDADVDEVRSVSARRTSLVALAVAAIGGVYLGQAIRWRAIARTPSVSTGRFAEMVVSGVAVNNVLPGRVGGPPPRALAQVAARIPGGRALATVFLDRVFDVVALVAFPPCRCRSSRARSGSAGSRSAGSRSSSPSRSCSSARASTSAGGLASAAAGAACCAASRGTPSRASPTRSVACGRSGSAASASPSGGCGGSRPGSSSPAPRDRALARRGGVRDRGDQLGVAIPSSPGFIGTYQWLGVSALALFGVPTEEALAFSILMQAVWYVPTLVVGGGLLPVRLVRTLRPGRTLAVGEAVDG